MLRNAPEISRIAQEDATIVGPRDIMLKKHDFGAQNR
jgi:hypothetical protein